MSRVPQAQAVGPVQSTTSQPPGSIAHGVPFRCPSSPDTGPGLTDLGKELIGACNRLRIMIDLSHLNERGFWDVAAISNAPLVATHSNAHALSPHSRNLTDIQLAAIREPAVLLASISLQASSAQTVIGISDTPIELVIKHIDHILKHVGEDGVGFGSDFDGAKIPTGIGNAAGLQNLISLNDNGRTTDQVASYFGMRKISIGKVGEDDRMLLNNQPVFQLGPLDQGFWPDGIYTAPTDEALKSDIETMKAMGFNMVRKHEKVEPARWYYWTDKLGLLVWQDMPSPSSYLDQAEAVPPLDKAEFESELRRMVETHWNHPSIALWTIFNEAQGQFDTPRLVSVVRALDPSRLVNEASGDKITGAGDVNDLHHYPEPGVRSPTPSQALANGEFGGIGNHVQGHSWDEGGFGYTNVSTPNDLLYLYAEYLLQLNELNKDKGLSAAIYTQLTDVMTEVNGLVTYDRVPKIDVAKIAEANHFNLAMPTYSVGANI